MKYKIIVGTSPEDLSGNVNSALSNGWKLQGGVAVHIRDGSAHDCYCQAVIKEEELVSSARAIKEQ